MLVWCIATTIQEQIVERVRKGVVRNQVKYRYKKSGS